MINKSTAKTTAPTKISSTELARNLSDILNRVRYRGESFIVERNGQKMAELTPGVEKKDFTLKDLAELWLASEPDEGFADDLEAIQNSQELMSTPPTWPV